LQAVRSEGELRVTCIRSGAETERILRELKPLQMETVPLGLEDAFINYLSEHGEKTFIMSELEAKS